MEQSDGLLCRQEESTATQTVGFERKKTPGGMKQVTPKVKKREEGKVGMGGEKLERAGAEQFKWAVMLLMYKVQQRPVRSRSGHLQPDLPAQHPASACLSVLDCTPDTAFFSGYANDW